MTKLAQLAAKSLASGVRMQDLDDALLALVPAEARDAVRLAMRLKAQFTPYQQAVADACEWCQRRQTETQDDPDAIMDQAAARFGVESDSINHAWRLKDWKALNRLMRHRNKS